MKPTFSSAVLAVLCVLVPAPAAAKEGDLIAFVPFAVPSPQDIAYDTEDGTFWVTVYLQNTVYHYTSDLLREIEKFEAPVGEDRYLTGCAYNSLDSTILVADSITGHIFEIGKNGNATGREIVPAYLPLVNEMAGPVLLGMSFDPGGDGGRGSIYLVEAVGTLIYEIRLDGSVIRYFSHPDDPDGFPGKGSPASICYDVDLIFQDREVAGFYVTGGRGSVAKVRRLGPDGSYTGVSVPLDDSGGTVGGILRKPFRVGGAEAADAYVCVVQSNVRFAILEGGEPSFRDILDVSCSSKGRDVELTWSVHQAYDGIEVREGCSILETLPGTATEWRHTFETDGAHVLGIRAFQGASSSEPPPCTVVVGGGEILAAGDATGGATEYMVPVDLATNGEGILLVSTNLVVGGELRARILLFDYDFVPLGGLDVTEAFSGPEDYVSGIAYARDGADELIYLFNASTSTVGVFDSVGALVATFPAKLPNLEEDPEAEPDYGFVWGMTYDPAGDAGAGSLWLIEVVRGWIYEIDLEGDILRDYPHPYWAIEPPPPDSPYSANSSGISLVPWGSGEEVCLSGGALRDQAQPHIFQASKATGQVIPGTTIPTDAIRQYGSRYLFAIEGVLVRGQRRWIVLTRDGKEAWLLQMRPDLSQVGKPSFLVARQETHRDAVKLRFVANGPYDSVEVFRDCAKIADLPGSASAYTDPGPAPGVHQYAVRGVRGGVVSALESASLRVGAGAILEQRILWPALAPEQLARDPGDGSFYVSGRWPGQERQIHHFDRDFGYLDTREIRADPPWQPAALAVRRPEGGDGELYYITWQQPVPLGGIGSQRFLLVKESLVGEFLGSTEIFPPSPTNGFITYPTGLTWNGSTDTFFYLERNSKTFVEMSTDGVALRQFPHPSPPFQNFVFALGVSAAPERGTILFTTAGRHEHRVTMVREMTLEGALTGLELPLDQVPHGVYGICVDGGDLIAVGTYMFGEILRLKALPRASQAFIRGDSDRSGVVNLTDAVVTLVYLFQGGPEPSCLDAADADDSGLVNLTDAVVTLMTLFMGRGPLPVPYPEPGLDPTDDDMECL